VVIASQVTTELEAEHRVIQKVVSAMAALQHDILEGGKPDLEALRQVVEFMRLYGDGLHHGKEEALLFPALEAMGVSVKGCPIGVLLAEHVQGRTLIARLAEAIDAFDRGDETQSDAIAETLGELVKLYPSHIWKEDFLAFPMSEKILGPAEKAALAAQYVAVNETMGQVERERLEALAESLMRAHDPA
jgi:hemerythrin-like domain-containing protein